MSEKPISFISKAVNVWFGLFFSFVIVVSLYFLADYAMAYSSLAPLAISLIVLSAFAVCAGLGYLEQLFAKKLMVNKRFENYVFAVLLLILIGLQIWFALRFDLTPVNDLKHVSNAAENFARYGTERLYEGLPERHQKYFVVYPNNHLLFLLISLMYKIQFSLTGGISNTLPTIVNILGIDISYFLMYACARMIHTPQKALVCAVRGIMFTPLITYSLIFYTDTMAMPWFTLALYLYLKWCKDKERGASLKKQLLMLGLCGSLLAVAFKLKGSAGVLLPAILIDLLCRQKSMKAKVLPFVQLSVIFLISCTLISNIACNTLGITKEEFCKHRFPAMHWIMMGADGNGGYNVGDFYYTRSFEGYENKMGADMERLEEKLENQGIEGFVIHLLQKIGYTWKDGTYMIRYYMPDAKAFSGLAFLFIASVTHYTLLFGMAKSLLIKRKVRNDALSGSFVIKITLMGLTAFLLLWEARCRYLISFFFLFTLL